MKGHVLPGIKQRVEESPVKQKTIKELDNKAAINIEPPHIYKPITKEEAEAYKKTPDKKTPDKKTLKKDSPVPGKFIDAIKKGNFRDAGNTLKHEIKGIGSGIKAALKDDYNTTSKARDIEHAYNWTKNRSAEKQRVKDAGLEWKDRKKENN